MADEQLLGSMAFAFVAVKAQLPLGSRLHLFAELLAATWLENSLRQCGFLLKTASAYFNFFLPLGCYEFQRHFTAALSVDFSILRPP